MTRNNSGACKGKVTVSCGPGGSFSVTTAPSKAVSVFSQVLSSLGSETWFNIMYSKLQHSQPLPQGGPNRSPCSQHATSLLRLQKAPHLRAGNTQTCKHSGWSNQEKHFGYWTHGTATFMFRKLHLFAGMFWGILTLQNNYFILLLGSIRHT